MKVAIGQFVVGPRWQDNVATCTELMAQAAEAGASLLVLPEAVLARQDDMPDLSVQSAQPLSGAYVRTLCEASRNNDLTTVLTLHIPTSEGRAANTLISVRGGRSLLSIRKYISTMPLTFRSHDWLMQGMRLRLLLLLQG